MDPDRAIRRMFHLTATLTALGATIYSVLGGWRGGGGFLLGGLTSYLNFYWLKRTVSALGEAAGRKPPRARVAVFLGLRYLLLALGAYAILKFTEISLM